MVIAPIASDPMLLNALVSLLKADYTVRPFISGAAALEHLKSNQVDLLILDHRLSDMTGFAALDAFRHNHEMLEVPIIYLGETQSESEEIEALELGASEYIAKPIKRPLFLLRVGLQMRIRGPRRELDAIVEMRMKKLMVLYGKCKMRETMAFRILAKASDLHSQCGGDHDGRITEFVRILVDHVALNPSVGYDLPKKTAESIIDAAMLHDLGKFLLPDSLLSKAGKLTSGEYEAVKAHAKQGGLFWEEQIADTTDSFLLIAQEIINGHHERWDGSGYPLGLSGANIPLSARIVAIADVYDALTSERTYRRALPHENAVSLIVQGSGTLFDPHLVAVFTQYTHEFQQIIIRSQQRETLRVAKEAMHGKELDAL